MTIDQWVGSFSAVISFAGLLLVAVQLRDSNRQRQLESQIRLYDINRELVSMGFSHPHLFGILEDAEGINPTLERRYLQLWLNQLALIKSFQESGGFRKDVGASFNADLRDMVVMSNMRRQWERFGKYYPTSFQRMVNEILDKAGRE
jgi:hypothetical protein